MQARGCHNLIDEGRALSDNGAVGLTIHIRAIREARGLTVSDLAAKVGISTPHMSQVERGIKNLNNHLLERIGAALDVPPQALISGDKDARWADVAAILGRLSDEDRARVEDFARALQATKPERTR